MNKEELEKLYLIDRKSTRDIAKILGVSQLKARQILRENQIPIRTYKDNKTPVPKGSKMPENHRKAISEALMGFININPETGRGYRYNSKFVPCHTCGKMLERPQGRLKNNKFQFCNQICSGKHQSTLTGIKNPQFKSVEKPCLMCGKIILANPSRIKNRKYGIFCSQFCSGEWKSKNLTGSKIYNFKGGYDRWENYGESWPYARRQALKRDNYTCQNCFKTKQEMGKNPDVHHKIPFRKFGLGNEEEANGLNNLICYCNVCHTKKEYETQKSSVIDFEI